MLLSFLLFTLVFYELCDLRLFGLQFPHCENEDNNITPHKGSLWGFSESIQVKDVKQCCIWIFGIIIVSITAIQQNLKVKCNYLVSLFFKGCTTFYDVDMMWMQNNVTYHYIFSEYSLSFYFFSTKKQHFNKHLCIYTLTYSWFSYSGTDLQEWNS